MRYIYVPYVHNPTIKKKECAEDFMDSTFKKEMEDLGKQALVGR